MNLRARSNRREPATEGLTVAAARAFGRALLAQSSTTPALDTDVLIEHVTGFSRTAQITQPEAVLEDIAAARVLDALRRRAAGEPLAYVTGTKSFRTIELVVDPRVLVPRPETELLVEVGLTALSALRGTTRVIDLGTGSGAVALALATELAGLGDAAVAVFASDISHEALTVAAANRARLGLDGRVRLIESDLLGSVIGEFDLILANLPYLRHDQRDPSTACEPELALYAGSDGLDLYRRLLPQVRGALTAGGLLACEIDPAQSETMRALALEHLAGAAAILPDLSGRDRIIVAGAVDIVRTVIDTWPYGA